MASSAKRCLYEVLGLSRDCSPDEIRSAYKKLALQRHPDKLVQSGVPESEATAQFQELVNAYEVLSDPRERAWYDSHRSQILFSNSAASSNASGSSSVVPNLFSFFSNSVYNGYGDTGKGFYKVYGEVFEKVYVNEVNFAKKMGLGLPKEAPLMGNLDCPYAQVTAFYNYWLGFVTIMDFCWVDQYDVMAGPNRKSRRVMEDENKKLRKKARREYNDTVRGLAEFVKKRDKRVIDMQVKRKEEMERKKEEERERRKELERQKAERARAYEEPEWTVVDEEVEDEVFEELVEEEDEKKEQFYCVVCGKKFKSEKQWKNHEQSKKHKEKVAELRRAFSDEDKAELDETEEGEEDEVGEDNEAGYFSADNGVDGQLPEKFENSVRIEDDKNGDNSMQSSDDDVEDVSGSGLGTTFGSGDDEASMLEASMLEAMISGRKKNNRRAKASAQQVKVDVDSDEMDFMEYNNTKNTRRNRGGRRRKGRKPDEEVVQAHAAEAGNPSEEDPMPADGSSVEQSPSHHLSDDENEADGDGLLEKTREVPKQPVDRKGRGKKEDSKSKNATKGKKQKEATMKASAHECEKCGLEFESRNKLHKHLSDTGHASLKRR